MTHDPFFPPLAFDVRCVTPIYIHNFSEASSAMTCLGRQVEPGRRCAAAESATGLKGEQNI